MSMMKEIAAIVVVPQAVMVVVVMINLDNDGRDIDTIKVMVVPIKQPYQLLYHHWQYY